MALGLVACASAPSAERASQRPPNLPLGVQAISLLGDTLRDLPLSAATRDRYAQQLREAQAAYDHTPTNADSIVWLARRLAYLGRLRESIAIYTTGVARYPDDAWLYRHRGHRYISVREFDHAIADLERATKLVDGKADEVEPDGQPNALNVPIGTLQSNIAYHLALAYYLEGDYVRALPVYRRELAIAQNDDRRASIAYWLYISLRRLGREAEAADVIRPFGPDTKVIENLNYLRLLRMFKGELAADSVFAGASSGEMSVTDATSAYGVAAWQALNGHSIEAERLYRRLIAGGQWGAFGYIAAEVELARIAKRSGRGDD